jgi:dihydrodipicolinate synthase/N-acetylneuraminate lyase
LGSAIELWNGIIEAISEKFEPVEQEWKSSKSDFGRMCLLRQKKRTLLYLTPQKGSVLAGIVLGERAVSIALASELPDEVKTLLREARQYAEGRGIRFVITHGAEISSLVELIRIKTTPK